MSERRESVLPRDSSSTSINSTEQEFLVLDEGELRKGNQGDSAFLRRAVLRLTREQFDESDRIDGSSGTDSTTQILILNRNGYKLFEDGQDYKDPDKSLSEDEIEDASDLDTPQENMTAANWKEHVWPVLRTVLLPILSTLSSISTMYASQDVVLEALKGMGYTPDDMDSMGQDIDSVGQDEEKLLQLFTNIAALSVLWSIPMITIIANSVMRFFGAIKTKEFLQKLVQGDSGGSRLWILLYLAFALQTSISDTLINVLTSATLKEEWLPIFIKGEGLLSLVFLLPLNIYFMHILHQRLQCAWDKYSKGDDRKLLSKRLEVIFYELRNVSLDKQAEKLKALCRGIEDIDGIDGIELPTTYAKLMALSPDQLAQLAEIACKNANLPDGSSWGSTAATGITAGFAFLAGAAIIRSPYAFYTATCQFPSAAAWFLSAISGVTKSAMYLGSYDNLMWCAKNYSRLFGTAPFLYGVGAALLACSAAGFWEVGALSLAVVFEKVAENPTWWFELLNAIIYGAGVAANTSSAASLVVEKGEEKRQSELELKENPDLAMGFKELASKVLNPPKKVVTDEESPEAAEGMEHFVSDREESLDESSRNPPTEITPLSGVPSRSERSSGTAWCGFFSGFSNCISSIAPRTVRNLVNTVCAPCFN